MRTAAEENHATFPIGSKIILRDFYVDDLTSGADSVKMAESIKSETSELLKNYGFTLRKWASNVSSLRDVNISDKEFTFLPNNEYETRTIGIVWNCNTNEIKFSGIPHLKPLQNPTKRSILSRIALIYDPLGLLGPSVVIAKVFMQELWRVKGDWDDPLPIELKKKWQDYEDDLPSLRLINVPRAVVISNSKHIEIHGFADASEIAYGACLYIRCTSQSNVHTVKLLSATPLKVITIPKLELCAALLLAQLFDKTRRILECKIDSIYLWSDSTIVLHWLQSCARDWSPFVANRIGEIQELTPINQWRHVMSSDNPADLLSRGVKPALLESQRLWWFGPQWLSLDESDWPQHFPITDLDKMPERRAKVISTYLSSKESKFDIFDKFSDFNKLVRITALLNRLNRLKQ